MIKLLFKKLFKFFARHCQLNIDNISKQIMITNITRNTDFIKDKIYEIENDLSNIEYINEDFPQLAKNVRNLNKSIKDCARSVVNTEKRLNYIIRLYSEEINNMERKIDILLHMNNIDDEINIPIHSYETINIDNFIKKYGDKIYYYYSQSIKKWHCILCLADYINYDESYCLLERNFKDKYLLCVHNSCLNKMINGYINWHHLIDEINIYGRFKIVENKLELKNE
jgi:hypothetical protein